MSNTVKTWQVATAIRNAGESSVEDPVVRSLISRVDYRMVESQPDSEFEVTNEEYNFVVQNQDTILRG